MRCHICDKPLSSDEIKFNKDHKDFDPCLDCLEVIDSVFSDDDEDDITEQITFQFLQEEREQEQNDEISLDKDDI